MVGNSFVEIGSCKPFVQFRPGPSLIGMCFRAEFIRQSTNTMRNGTACAHCRQL